MAEDAPAIDLFVANLANSAWRAVVEPWLRDRRHLLGRSYVLVPTHGQAQSLKQRCLAEGIGLFGVEFLTPGLARKKWAAAGARENSDLRKPMVPREFLHFGLRLLIDRRVRAFPSDAAEWGFWKSLQSDSERALDDFEELLRAGFRASDFPVAGLAEVFSELTAWVEACGYGLGAVEDERAGLAPAVGGVGLGERVLLYGFGLEHADVFFLLIAFVRRFRRITVVLPSPLFGPVGPLEEGWVEAWRSALGVEPFTLPDAGDENCALVGTAANGGEISGPELQRVWQRSEGVVGQGRLSEAVLVADRVRAWLERGAEIVGVIALQSDHAVGRLREALHERGIDYVDLLSVGGTVSAETQFLSALLTFYERGSRLDELLELWPWLRVLGFTTLGLTEVRRVAEDLFDLGSSHRLADLAPRWRDRTHEHWREFVRVAEPLLPRIPAEMLLGEAFALGRKWAEVFSVGIPSGWEGGDELARRYGEPAPAAEVLKLLRALLPTEGPAVSSHSGFARVILTTRRRASGVAWTHLAFMGSNAGGWPERTETSCWLTDDQRTELNRRARFSFALLTGEQKAQLARAGYERLTADCSRSVLFSAATVDEREPAVRLRPNLWLERLLWRWLREKGAGAEVERILPAWAQFANAAGGSDVPDEWIQIWNWRRDPRAPFDEHFLARMPAQLRPRRLPARLIESGLVDPAEFWFEAIAGVRRWDWEPLARNRRKGIGVAVHRILAEVLGGSPVGRDFVPKPKLAEAEARLGAALARWSADWPPSPYWRSILAEIATMSRRLLHQVLALPAGDQVFAEMNLPADATIDLGGELGAFSVSGRMDLVIADQQALKGAEVAIVDYKTGSDQELSAKHLVSSGAGLQLGVYLAAAVSLGVRNARVWMVRPEEIEPKSLGLEDLGAVAARLGLLEMHLRTGDYGALTREPTDYKQGGFDWPLACAPIPFSVLESKYAATFGPTQPAERNDA